MAIITAYHQTEASLPRVIAQWIVPIRDEEVTNDWLAKTAEPHWSVFTPCVGPERNRFEHFSRFQFKATDNYGFLLASIEYDEQIAVKKFHLLREDEEEW